MKAKKSRCSRAISIDRSSEPLAYPTALWLCRSPQYSLYFLFIVSIRFRSFPRADEVFFSGTVGITYSFDDEYDNFDLSLSSQYYYNGQGYADQDFIINNMAGFLYLISQGELTAADILQRGQHYTAASVSWREMFGTDFTFSTFWMGNMVDLSGMVDCALKYALDDYLSISVGLKQTYGDEGAEFTPSGALTALYIKTSLGTGKF